MINPSAREREQLLDEVDRRLGYLGYAEFWLHVPAPERASDAQMDRWRALGTGEKLRVTEQYDRHYEAIRNEVFNSWSRRQRIRNGIRSASVLLALAAVLVFCLGTYDRLPTTTTGSPAFLPMWWLVSLVIMAGLYAAACKLGEYYFDPEERRSNRFHHTGMG